MADHLETGRAGEQLAVAYLEQKNYVILATNWRHHHTEIDIIARSGQTLVFVEVKTRKTDYFGYPEEAVNRTKQQHMQRAAQAWIHANNWQQEIRFDIIAITLENRDQQVYHIEDAFFPK